jgi:formylglycine-generating enzyme required for sulfatase activity
VQAHLDDARALGRRSLDDVAADWQRAVDGIASSARYGGLRIAPQLGLVPLGEDPETGLWEFWHVLAGARPELDDRAEAWEIEERSGLVLVLLPGGQYAMGSPADDDRRDWNETQHAVEVAPFFLAKHETNQAQWERWTGSNPSYYRAGTAHFGVAITPLHPVEQVTWHDAVEAGARLGLRLPSEEEWEYACRAGSDMRYHWGPDEADLEGHENLGDQSMWRTIGTWAAGAGSLQPAPWDDAQPLTSRVASFRSNAFGLFDVHGNVAEWTSSEYFGDYAIDPGAPRDGKGDRIARGGSHLYGPAFARCATRQPLRPRNTDRQLGVRYARDLAR